jgi:hypothetical protein
MITEAPTAPVVGVRLVMAGAGVTVKGTALLATPAAFTITLPVVAPAGTFAVILVALQAVTDVTAVPLNVTVLVPCVAPKLVPAMITEAPTAPVFGSKLVIAGGGVTVKVTPVLASAPTVTTTLPVVAPAGTVTAMLAALQVLTTAAVPLNVTVLPPCAAPKFVPAMVTNAPIAPEFGAKLVMPGATVKGNPLLATPDTVTTTLPVMAPAGTVTTMLVALQVTTTAAVPLKVTVLVPCAAPKFVPVIVIDAPTGPEA